MPNLHNLTAAQSARAIRDGDASAVELVSALLERSRALDPSLKVWVMLDEDAALAAARSRDRELASEGPRGPLHGVPVGVKDIYYTRGVLTTACSRILADFVPDYDSTAVAKLRRAGAIILGKTVTTEFANGDPPPTVNPWDAERTPGGSSSGSAVGVAARMFPAALGSQTAGSVLRPASFNGVVGLKPTFGRISRYGVVPVAASLDTMGHMARSVEDAALLLDAMAGYDPLDPDSSERATTDYAAAASRPLESPRVGLVRRFFWERATADTRAHTDAIAQCLADAGATVVEVELSADFDAMLRAHRTLMTTEAADAHRHWFPARADDYAPNVRGVIEAGMKASATEYLDAKRVQAKFARDLSDAMRPFDVVLTPTTPAAAPRDLTTTGPPMFQTPFTFGGFPAITIPSGLDADGIPLGAQLAAAHWRDARLLSVAAWAEEALGEDARALPHSLS